jgi:hypothetical protein
MIAFQTAAKDILFSCAVIVAFLTALLAIDLVPSEAGPVTVITNPFSSQSAVEVIALTQGTIAGASRWPWIAIAADSQDPDFKKKLREAGALLVIRSLATACLKDVAVRGTPKR